MKLTKNQIEALYTLNEDKSLPRNGCKIHYNTMRSLYLKYLVQIHRYANGEFWEISGAGLYLLDSYNKSSK